MTLPSPESAPPAPAEPDIEVRLPRLEGALGWADLFGNSLPVEIEIGSGKGRFIIQSALRNPAINYLGIERAGKFFRLMKERSAQSGAGNIRLLRSEADYFIKKFVPAGSVRAVHIYFPDPWPKNRHHRRRLVNQDFLDLTRDCLAPGGTILFATDFADYFKVMLATARACRGLQELYCKTLQPSEADPEEADTHYERKYLMQGRLIYRAAYSKILP